MLQGVPPMPSEVHVVVNWLDEVAAKVPAGR